jgi:hypothetical protein
VADRNPDKKLEDKFTVTTAYYAAALRPGDHDLLHSLLLDFDVGNVLKIVRSRPICSRYSAKPI